MNQPFAVAGEYAACASDAGTRSRTASEAVARRRRLMGTSWRRDEVREREVYGLRGNWCRRPDSNRYGLPHTPLKRTCLPIPPRRRVTASRDLPRDWRGPVPERPAAEQPARRSRAAPEPERQRRPASEAAPELSASPPPAAAS